MNNSADDNREIFDAYKKSRSIEDRNKIVEKYLYIVNILVRKYLNRGVDYDDLYQVGSMALVLAAERYDPERGVDFPAFAAPTILGEIKRYFRDKGWAIKVPRKMKDLSVKIPSVKQKLEAELQRTPKVSEIAQRLDVTEEDVLQAMDRAELTALTLCSSRWTKRNRKAENTLSNVIREKRIPLFRPWKMQISSKGRCRNSLRRKKSSVI